MRRPLFLLLALAVTGAHALSAQGDPRLGRLDPRTRLAVAEVIDSLARAGVPTEPLIDKALEGQTKGAPGPRIVGAVREWGLDLARVQAQLGPTAHVEDVIAGGTVYRAGVPLAALAALAQARGGRDLLVPLTVISELAAAGVPADSAAALIVSIAQHGGSDNDFRSARSDEARGHGRPATAGQGQGTGGGRVKPPRTVPNKKGKLPGAGNGNGKGQGHPIGHP